MICVPLSVSARASSARDDGRALRVSVRSSDSRPNRSSSLTASGRNSPPLRASRAQFVQGVLERARGDLQRGQAQHDRFASDPIDLFECLVELVPKRRLLTRGLLQDRVDLLHRLGGLAHRGREARAAETQQRAQDLAVHLQLGAQIGDLARLVRGVGTVGDQQETMRLRRRVRRKLHVEAVADRGRRTVGLGQAQLDVVRVPRWAALLRGDRRPVREGREDGREYMFARERLQQPAQVRAGERGAAQQEPRGPVGRDHPRIVIEDQDPLRDHVAERIEANGILDRGVVGPSGRCEPGGNFHATALIAGSRSASSSSAEA